LRARLPQGDTLMSAVAADRSDGEIDRESHLCRQLNHREEQMDGRKSKGNVVPGVVGSGRLRGDQGQKEDDD
jgi:hypothetical protein